MYEINKVQVNCRNIAYIIKAITINVYFDLSPSTKDSSKWLKGLSIGPETLYLIKEKIGNVVELLTHEKNF